MAAMARRVAGVFTAAVRRSASFAHLCRAEEHVVRTSEFERGEIEREFLRQRFAVPDAALHELLIVVAAFVPAREEGTAEVKPLPIPALRHHVNLFADLLLVNLLR